MPASPSPTPDIAAALHVAEHGARLAALARAHGLDLLAYLLDMAVLEAGDRAGVLPAHRPEEEAARG